MLIIGAEFVLKLSIHMPFGLYSAHSKDRIHKTVSWEEFISVNSLI